MEVLILLIAVSLSMALGAVLFFAWTVRQRTLDHADRLALLPLDDDELTTLEPSAAPAAATANDRHSMSAGVEMRTQGEKGRNA